MESWVAIQKRGLQVRDTKNPESSCGTTMLFKTVENFTLDNLLRLLRPLMEECFTLITSVMCFNAEKINFVIKDTKDTDPNDRDEYKVYTERK